MSRETEMRPRSGCSAWFGGDVTHFGNRYDEGHQSTITNHRHLDDPLHSTDVLGCIRRIMPVGPVRSPACVVYPFPRWNIPIAVLTYVRASGSDAFR